MLIWWKFYLAVMYMYKNSSLCLKNFNLAIKIQGALVFMMGSIVLNVMSLILIPTQQCGYQAYKGCFLPK